MSRSTGTDYSSGLLDQRVVFRTQLLIGFWMIGVYDDAIDWTNFNALLSFEMTDALGT